MAVKAFVVRSDPTIGVVKFIGDYEMSLHLLHGRDLVLPVTKMLRAGFNYLILDFSQSKCFDHPYGPGPLYECQKGTRAQGGSFRIVTACWLQEWMELIGLNQVFDGHMAGTVAEAIQQLRAEISHAGQ